MSVLLDDIPWADGTPNMGGLTTNFAVCFASEVLYWPQLVDPIVNPEDNINLVTPFVLHTGKKFRKGYLTMDTGEVKDMGVGEFDGKSFESSLELFHPGTKADALAAAAAINNSNMVFLAKDANKLIRVIGNEDFPAKVDTTEIATGKATKDRKGWKLIVKSRGSSPAPIYTESWDDLFIPSVAAS